MPQTDLSRYPSRLVRKIYTERRPCYWRSKHTRESTKWVLHHEHHNQLKQPSRLGGRKLGRIDEMEEWVVDPSATGSPEYDREIREAEEREEYAVAERAAHEVCLLDIARPGRQRPRRRGKSGKTPTIDRVADSEVNERWESESVLSGWDDTEDWDGRSKDWEIPIGDYEEGWEVYIAGQKCDRAPQNLYSAVLRGNKH
ncbi:hypothetical protein B0H13DRAFT_2313555 [Mycena leptocephala]|nr:hypothetical protein B0H13DRAFT_2313555 [Mycena leptocephala]